MNKAAEAFGFRRFFIWRMSEACRCRRSILPFSLVVPRSSPRLRAIVPGEGVIDALDAHAPLRVRRADRLSRRCRCSWSCPRRSTRSPRSCAGATTTGSRSCRAAPAPRSPAAALPLADGDPAGASARFNRVLDIDYADRCARVQPGVTNLAITKRRRARRLLLRARSQLEPDRLHDRRQCRREFRRRALPQVRPHHQQPARRRDW
jgi:hypothetical protein